MTTQFSMTRQVHVGATRLLRSLVVAVPVLLLQAGCAKEQPANATNAAGAVNSAARVEQFAKLPDWSGIWHLVGSPALLEREDAPAFVPGTRNHPPYTPEWEAQYVKDLVNAEHQGDPNYPDQITDTHTLYCAAGMPHVMAGPWEYQFIATPEATTIVVDKETRFIPTDGREFLPEDSMWPILRGWSNGHWEGDTLVVETINVKEGLWGDFTPVKFSSKAKYLERIRSIGPNMIENQVTITDPVALTRPWTWTKRYERLAAGTWPAEPEVCGNPEDRNPIVDGKLQVVLPGDK